MAATPVTVVTLRDAQGQRTYRAFSAASVERGLEDLIHDVRGRYMVEEGMITRWIGEEGGHVIETNSFLSHLSHGNRDDSVWFAVKPNGGIDHNVGIAHSENTIQGAIQGRGEGWSSQSAAHTYVDPVQ